MKHSETVEPKSASQSSMLLATLSGLASTLLTGLIFLGHARRASANDLLPCLLTALFTPLLVQTAGRLSGRATVWIPTLFALLGVLLGKWLSWDLSGYVAGLAGDDAPANEGWISVVRDRWKELPTSTRWQNAAAYLLTPVIAGGLVPACHRLCRNPSDALGAAILVEQDSVKFRSRRWLIGLAAAWSIGVIVVHIVYSSDRTGFLNITLPVVPINQTNSLWGFAYLVDGSPVMSEEIPGVEQVGWFRGAVRSDNNFRFLRAGYAWLATVLFPWLPSTHCLIALNLAAWGIFLVCVWRLTANYSRDDIACCLATMLASTGIGFVVHWHATTPHLVSFALYALGLTVLVESRLTKQVRPWDFHLAFGVFLGLVSLVYNVWLMVALVYVVAGMRKQRWLHLLAALCVAAAFSPTWRTILPGLGINILDVEGAYLRRALVLWKEAAESGAVVFLARVAGAMIESLTAMESPFLLLIGAIGLCCTIERGRRLFVLAAVAAPVLACTLFAPSATARGYIVYGSSCLWFMAAGSVLSLLLRKPGALRWLGVLLTAIVLTGQLAWSWAAAMGYSGPVITYAYGWDDGAPLLMHRQPEVVSLTGQDAVPVLYGGSGTPDSTHVYRETATEPSTRQSRILAYLSRLIFVLGACLLLSALCQRRTSRVACVLVTLGLTVVSTEVSLLMPNKQPTFWDMQAIVLDAGESVTVHIDLSSDVGAALRAQLARQDSQGALYVPATESCTVTWTTDGKNVPLGPISRQEAKCLDALPLRSTQESATWQITLTNATDGTLPIAGWQTLETPGKSQDVAAAACLPAIEFRVRETDTGRLLWLGF